MAGSPPDAPSLESLAAAEVRLEEARFELQVAREKNARLEEEVRKLEHRLASRNAEFAALRSRAAERERYIKAIHASIAWKIVEGIRGLFGRRWSV